MSDIRVQGTPVLNVKTLNPAKAATAQQILAGKKDGYDTVGVTTPAGDQLVLVKSKKALSTATKVTVDGAAAKVNFVENEKNTFGERFKAPFKSTAGKVLLGVGATIAMVVAVPFGLALSVPTATLVIGTALWGAFGAAVIGAAMTVGSTTNATVRAFFKPNEQVTDGLTK